MHNAAFAALGLNWRYLAFEVDPKNLRAAIAGARAMNFAGLNLTVPHKLLAVDMVDALDASAKKWGAVNTIKFQSEGAVGFNTDADAIVASLREDLKMELRGAKVLLLGAGGAGTHGGIETGVGKCCRTFSRQPHAKQGRGNRCRNQKTISVRESFRRLSENRRWIWF